MERVGALLTRRHKGPRRRRGCHRESTADSCLGSGWAQAGERPRHRHLRAAPHAPVPRRTDATILPPPRTSTGEITVYPGYQVDSRPTTDGKAFLWLDYPNDGRYLIQHHDADNFTVIPRPPTELQHRLSKHIAMFTERRRG
ncbi:ESX secretion-associated protein EspG [Nocardia sp. NPDC058518]|uniref:ESX secretion-associated protein EspG n=1 Tax=Nocardia sp. NPDC058518 TaxID=3346534 RepID=UPI00364B00D1